MTGFVLADDVIHVDVSCAVGSLSGVVDELISAAVVMAGVCEIVSVVMMVVLVIVPPLLDLMMIVLDSVLLVMVVELVSAVLLD